MDTKICLSVFYKKMTMDPPAEQLIMHEITNMRGRDSFPKKILSWDEKPCLI